MRIENFFINEVYVTVNNWSIPVDQFFYRSYNERMEISQKNSSPIKLWMFVFAIVFALSTVFSPSLFAQDNSVNSKSAAKESGSGRSCLL